MYPKEIEVKDQELERLTSTFKSAYADILKEINTATDFGVANRKAILAQIETILTGLGSDITDIVDEDLTKYYKQGANEAVKQLTNVGADVPVATGFNRVHKEAIQALVSDTAKSFGESLTGVSRSANLLLGRAVRQMITQKLAKNIVGGDALRQVKSEIKGILQEQGLDALIDKGGRRWSLDRYAEMLYRTKVVEARNRGLINRVAENGYDLVQVSRHPSSCPLCAPWQGKILSLTGQTKEFNGESVATLAQAEQDGLFHPNCRHAINTIVPSLASKTKIYDSTTQTYT